MWFRANKQKGMLKFSFAVVQRSILDDDVWTFRQVFCGDNWDSMKIGFSVFQFSNNNFFFSPTLICHDFCRIDQETFRKSCIILFTWLFDSLHCPSLLESSFVGSCPHIVVVWKPGSSSSVIRRKKIKALWTWERGKKVNKTEMHSSNDQPGHDVRLELAFQTFLLNAQIVFDARHGSNLDLYDELEAAVWFLEQGC